MSVITINKVAMYGVATKDAEKSIAFYRDILGLKPDPKSKYEFWAGDLCLSIWEPEKLGWPFEASNNGPAFHVDDIAAARTALEENGINFRGETIDTGVCRMAMFDDPDGNQLILHSRYAD